MENHMSNSQNTDTVISRKPRRVYQYKGRVLVCFAGERYISGEESAITVEHQVTKIEALEGNAPGEVTVTQRRPKRKGVTEVWKRLES